MLPKSSNDLAVKRAAIARAARAAKHDPAEASKADAARVDYRAAKLEDYITRALGECPPLSAEQRDRLALLLRPEATP